jgi:hypothetical protein
LLARFLQHQGYVLLVDRSPHRNRCHIHHPYAVFF